MGDRRLFWEKRRILFLWLAVALIQTFLITNGTFELIVPERMDQLFNSMLAHLLEGDLEVDSGAVGPELIRIDGRHLTHFGVLPALLRLPALLFVDLKGAHLARLSCLIASMVGCLALLLSATKVLRARGKAGSLTATAFVATLLLSGPTIFMLASAPVYHEPILWAASLAFWFNYILLGRHLDGRVEWGAELTALGALGSAALLARPSVGAPLCLVAALLVVLDLRRISGRRIGGFGPRGKDRHLDELRPHGICALLLLLGTTTFAAVNHGRFGNFFSVAVYDNYEPFLLDPSYLDVVRDHGVVNLRRSWLSLIYYLTGSLPLLHRLLEHADTAYGLPEGPPMGIALIGGLTFVAALVGVIRGLRPRAWAGAADLGVAALGQSLSTLVVLGYYFLAPRYIMDMWPLVCLCALVGLSWCVGWIQSLSRPKAASAFLVVVLLGCFSVWQSIAIMARYKTHWYAMDEHARGFVERYYPWLE
ncbi:MAG: hypothetical protein CME06_12190 [Gemmatimonadetes bacterium]|nr:hypothetical protein [Gemmatimonadota bacterium]